MEENICRICLEVIDDEKLCDICEDCLNDRLVRRCSVKDEDFLEDIFCIDETEEDGDGDYEDEDEDYGDDEEDIMSMLYPNDTEEDAYDDAFDKMCK